MKSDVWSFGVLLWELFSFGERPYQGTRWNEEFVNFLEQGHRLDKPQHCDEEFFKIMSQCWQWKIDDRPLFACLAESLGNWLEKCKIKSKGNNEIRNSLKIDELCDSQIEM